MSKIEIVGTFLWCDKPLKKPIHILLFLEEILERLNTTKDKLFGIPHLTQVLHRLFAQSFTNEDQYLVANTYFEYNLQIRTSDGVVIPIDVTKVLSGQPHFIEGDKLNKNGTPKTFVAHTVVMSTEQWEDFMAAGKQIEQEYPEEKDSYTGIGGTINVVIQRGQWLSRLSQSYLGGKQQRDIVTEIQSILSEHDEYDETADIDTFHYALKLEQFNARKKTPEEIEQRIYAIKNNADLYPSYDIDQLSKIVTELEQIRSEKAKESLGI